MSKNPKPLTDRGRDWYNARINNLTDDYNKVVDDYNHLLDMAKEIFNEDGSLPSLEELQTEHKQEINEKVMTEFHKYLEELKKQGYELVRKTDGEIE